MEHYDFAAVEVYMDLRFGMRGIKGVNLYCTDSAEADAVMSQLKEFYPKMKRDVAALPTGEKFLQRLTKLSDQDREEVLWWLVKQLCSRGWEPLGADSTMAVGPVGNTDRTSRQYQFRRKSR